ncbi:putative bifunctional diguanylate cyclase/phosphodiesterase [Amorphus coralli]|uniref:putative bifunctional diguanylate cyclase/phosphodiesterase n=1 Tax=Amorphus coralli TaxID=340680 RepID=UPI00035F8EF2|nr:bifunctional diguanylate cyclase/phosphodiesterase [Amorphus coralli]
MTRVFGQQSRPAGQQPAATDTVAALVRHIFDAAGAGVAVSLDGRVWRGVAAYDEHCADQVERAFVSGPGSDTGSLVSLSPDADSAGRATYVASRDDDFGGSAAIVTVIVVSEDTGLAGRIAALFDDISGIARQIVEFARETAQARRTDMLMSRIETMSKAGRWHLDLGTQSLSWSEEVFRIHGMKPVPTMSLDQALKPFAEETRTLVRKQFDDAVRYGSGFTFTYPILTDAGERKVVRVMGEVERDNGLTVGLFGVLQDVTEQKEAERRLWWTANHDPLTGLPNRMLFQDRLSRALEHAKRFDEEIALVILDVDNFKMVNDVYGHEAGDRLLKEISDILLDTIRTTDSIARLGGDEFALILGDLKTSGDMQPPLDRLKRATEFGFEYRGTRIPVRMSLGVALYPGHGQGGDELYRNADLALFRTKTNPERRLTVYESRFGRELQARDDLMRQIRAALSIGTIVPFYQPQFDLQTGAMVGAEVLARWIRDEQVVEAGSFLPAIDDYEVAPIIGAQIAHQVVAHMASYKAAFADAVPFSMNVSRSQIRNPEFLKLLTCLLDKDQVSYNDFILEISENTVTGRDNSHVGDRLRDLAERGLSFSFDDFGAGFSSLIHIESYSVRQVKIDRQLTQDVHFDSHKLAIVDGILRICSSLNIDVLAECVELEEQVAALKKLGIRHAQGNFLGRPMSFDEFMALNGEVARLHLPHLPDLH